MAISQAQIEHLIAQADIQGLRAIVDELDGEVRAIVEKVIKQPLTEAKKQAALKEVRAAVGQKDATVKQWLVTAVPLLYVAGMNAANRDAKNQHVSITGKLSFKTITVENVRDDPQYKSHLEAVNAALSESYLDFANGMNGVVRGAERVLNEALKRQIRLTTAQGQLTGSSVQEVAKEIRELLADQGFSVLIDRGGRQWTLQRYSEMLARTHLLKSSNEGTINRAGDFGIDIVEVSTHSNVPDQLCLDMEGRRFSISGKSDTFPKLTLSPPFHPRCRHTLQLIVEE